MIYCFHMPAFVFISGYFTYGHNENKAKLIQNTLIPFFICNTAFELIVSRSLRINIFTPVYIYWYLLSLFIWRCSIGCLKKVKGLLIIAVVQIAKPNGPFCGAERPQCGASGQPFPI